MTARARQSIALLLAVGVTLGLFWLMQRLIIGPELDPSEKRAGIITEFIRLEQSEDTVQERQREKPRPLEQPATVPRLETMMTPPLPTPIPLTPTLAPFPLTPTLAPSVPTLRPNLALADLPLAMAMTEPPADPPTGPMGPVLYTQSLRPVYQVKPHYPRRARLAGVSGWVRLEFVVAVDGSVHDVRVVEAEPRRGIFDQEAVRAVSLWRFHPQILDGQKVAAKATITVKFDLTRR